MRRGSGKGCMEIRTDPEEEPIERVFVSPSTDWKNYEGKTVIKLKGKQALYFTYTGTGHIDFKAFEMKRTM